MRRSAIAVSLPNLAPAALFVIVFTTLGILSGRFLEIQNLTNILIQSSALAVAAIGVTPVLLTAGVDLSVGSLMFVAVAVSGKLIYGGYAPAWAFSAAVLVGLAGGIVNGLLIVRLRIIPFVATLAMLFIARGFGLWLTNTRAMNMPDSVTHLGASTLAGVPLPVVVMAAVAIAVHWALSSTPWGRQIYAIGCDVGTARKAGISVGPILFSVYVLCSLCAALSGMISLSQTGAVSPSFGQQREFAAIAAAVLGGTSLFGGRGRVLPGTVFGAILFQTVENGLVIINANPYLHSMIVSVIIFLAVLSDTVRAAPSPRA